MTRRLFLRVLLPLALFLFNGSPSTRSPRGHAHEPAKRTSWVRHGVAAGLSYVVVQPREVAPDAELPMVVSIHGRGGEPRAPVGRYLDLDTPVRLILPRGPLRHGSGFAWMPVSAHAGDSAALNESLEERLRELADAMVVWRRRYPTRGLPIVTGFSQGGILSATVAVTHPESVSHAFPVAGWIPTPFAPTAFDPWI